MDKSGSSQVSLTSFELLLAEITNVLDLMHVANPQEEDASKKLETMGFDVGYRYVEKISMTNKDRIQMKHLEVMKFICKTFWTDIFNLETNDKDGRAAVNLKTNHKGTFVLVTEFKWLKHLSEADSTAKAKALKIAHFGCGLIRGALANFNIHASVTVEPKELKLSHHVRKEGRLDIVEPECQFKVVVK